MDTLTDPLALTLAAAAVLAVILLAVAVARSRRWGAACTRCDWRHRARTRPALEEAARHHAAGAGHDVVRLYVRGRA